MERVTRLELATSTLARCRSTRWAKPAYFIVVPPVGIEPTTRGFSVPCSTDWATEAHIWRPEWGSNTRPLAWQASVLTNWTTGPYLFAVNHSKNYYINIIFFVNSFLKRIYGEALQRDMTEYANYGLCEAMRFTKTQIMQNKILQLMILKKSNHAVRQIINKRKMICCRMIWLAPWFVALQHDLNWLKSIHYLIDKL